MSRDSICDFVLSVTTLNVARWDKNVENNITRKESPGKGIEDFTRSEDG
jgi:hypothetical protein